MIGNNFPIVPHALPTQQDISPLALCISNICQDEGTDQIDKALAFTQAVLDSETISDSDAKFIAKKAINLGINFFHSAEDGPLFFKCGFDRRKSNTEKFKDMLVHLGNQATSDATKIKIAQIISYAGLEKGLFFREEKMTNLLYDMTKNVEFFQTKETILTPFGLSLESV